MVVCAFFITRPFLITEEASKISGDEARRESVHIANDASTDGGFFIIRRYGSHVWSRGVC